jgi:hypothetical protein
MKAAKTKLNQVARAGRVALESGASQFGPLAAILWRPRGRRIFGKLVEGERRPAKRGKNKGREIVAPKPGGKSLFLLARSVTIPPRPYVEPALEKSRVAIGEIFRKRLGEALDA